MNYERLTIEIYSLIIRYLRLNKKLDHEFIKEFIEYVIFTLNLKPYVDITQNARIYNRGIGTYFYRDKDITIDLFKIFNQAEKLSKQLDVNLLLVYYLETSRILLHEVVHASQFRKATSPNTDIETKILKASLMYDIILNDNNKLQAFLNKGLNPKVFNQKNSVYLQNYDIAPEERLAETNAYYIMLMVLELLQTDANNLTIHYLNCFLKNLLRGYEKTLNPTKSYLEALETSQVLTPEELEGKDIPLVTRTKLGLAISTEEREELMARKRELANSYILK